METVKFFQAEDVQERVSFIAAISNQLEQIAFPPLDTVFRTGAEADTFFVVNTGLVGCVRRHCH